MPPEPRWQLKKGKRIYLPLTAMRVRRWIEEGRVSENDLVWRSGYGPWKRVGEVKEFKDLFKPKKTGTS